LAAARLPENGVRVHCALAIWQAQNNINKLIRTFKFLSKALFFID
jgi:hypothetical protein